MNYEKDEAILLGQRIAVGTKSELLRRARELIGVGGVITTVNPEILVNSVKNSALARTIDKSLKIPDGNGIKYAMKKRGVFTEVYPGVEICLELLKTCGSVGILGGEVGVAERAFSKIKDKCPTLRLAFLSDGYNYSVPNICRRLKAEKPDLMIVALGSPKQESVIEKIRRSSRRTVYIGVGGALDIYSGRKRRAPAAFRKMRCEWLWRTLREPKRLKRLPNLISFLSFEAVERREIL